MCDPTDPIIIDKITNGTSNGDALMKCYFVWAAENEQGFNVYNFHGQSGNPLILGLTVGERFDFVLPDVPDKIWRLKMTGVSCTFVGGHFLNRPTGVPLPDVVGEPDGSFQAQAGGAVADDTDADAVAAAAKA